VAANGELGELVLIDVEEDGGSEADFISPKLVQRLNLRTQPVEMTATLAFKTMTETFFATQKVELTLIGRLKKSLHWEFLVAPHTCPFSGVLAGRPFIKECGIPHTLFPEKKEVECNIIRQTKMTVCAMNPTSIQYHFGADLQKQEAERLSKERARAENEKKAAEVDALKKQQTQGDNGTERPKPDREKMQGS